MRFFSAATNPACSISINRSKRLSLRKPPVTSTCSSPYEARPMHVGMTTFFQNIGGPISDYEVYRHEISMADLAEPLGFDSIWGAEHHFDDYTMCPNVAQFLTYMAARTKRVKLGSMVIVLPWHDPIRLAEEVTVLDNLSDGRVILGIGRGLGRIEFRGFRAAMSESRPRFTEYAQAIMQGLETGYIEHAGEFYNQPRIAIRPAPIRSFRDRTYAASVSPQSLETMCRLGLGLLIIAQKPWEITEAELRDYRARFLALNRRTAPKPLIELHRRTRNRGRCAGHVPEVRS